MHTTARFDAAELGSLLTRAAAGDERAFAAVYDATSSRTFGLALRVVRDRHQAEEVAQEAYLEVWQQRSRFDPAQGSAMSWILMITHRKAVDRVRSAQARVRRELNDHELTRLGFPVSPDPTYGEVAAGAEAQRVRAALSALTPIQRQAVDLAYFGGLTHVQVADLVGVPLGTAKTRIRDALLRLSRVLDQQSEDVDS